MLTIGVKKDQNLMNRGARAFLQDEQRMEIMMSIVLMEVIDSITVHFLTIIRYGI